MSSEAIKAAPSRPPLDVARYEPALRRYLRRRAPAGQVDDLLQEVFSRLCGLTDPAAVRDMERYLFVVAASVLSRQHQRARPWEPIDDHPNDAALRDEVDPERSLLAKERIKAVLDGIEALPTRTRQVFLLHRFEEMTYQRIAGKLGISVSAVEKHMMAALKALILLRGDPR